MARKVNARKAKNPRITPMVAIALKGLLNSGFTFSNKAKKIPSETLIN
jgi:hypothetical protein